MATRSKKGTFIEVMEAELHSGNYTPTEVKAIKKLGKNLKGRMSKFSVCGQGVCWGRI